MDQLLNQLNYFVKMSIYIFQDLKIVPFVIRFFIKILHYLRKLAQHVQTNSMQLVYINGSRVRVVQLVHFVDQHSISEGREGFKGNFYKMYFQHINIHANIQVFKRCLFFSFANYL